MKKKLLNNPGPCSAVLILLLSGFAAFTSCRNEITDVSRPLLGTIITITIDGDPAIASFASSAAFDEIARIEKVFSIYNSDSGVSVINRDASMQSVKADEETLNLIKRSIDVSEKTDGAFDITFASLGKLWDFGKDEFVPPSAAAVKKILPAFNYKNILIDEKTGTVRFLNRDTKIGLGGIAKGYAVNRAVNVLKEKGVRNGIVACAGDIQVIGSKKGMPWIAGIRHPRDNSVIGSVKLSEGECISTSGDYERFKFYRGRRFHHIINPATGYPSDSGLVSVTVICNDSILADAYATAIFVMGLNRAKRFLKNEKGVSVVLVDEDLNVYVSERLKGRVSFGKDSKVQFI